MSKGTRLSPLWAGLMLFAIVTPLVFAQGRG